MTTKPSYTNQWTEPESTVGVFPFNTVTQTESGHSLQFDDTPEKERVRIQHRFGTFIDMHPNGDEVHKIFGDGYEITIKDKNVLIQGVCNIQVNGDCNMNVDGDYNLTVGGDFNLTTKGILKAGVKKDISIFSDSDVTLGSTSATGSLQLDAGGSASEIIMNSPVQVFADLTAANLFAAGTSGQGGKVDAAGGVSAGLLGFITSGGVSVGMPAGAAVPGTVLASVNVTAPSAAFGVAQIGTATCGIMDAVLMTDVMNTAIYNSHIHKSPKGPTSPPLMRFVGV
jgi:hypothetical protein